MNNNFHTKHNTLAGLIPSSDGFISKLAGVSYFMKRKAISQKLRFEIFKRDSFTCQYCGSKAPDVILEVDHINPVAKGGKNDLLNLTTSCEGCNAGKSDRLLSDTSVIDLQRKQIEELQERRNQINMMLDWKVGLAQIKDEGSDRVIEYWNNKALGFHASESGIGKLKAWVRKYGAIKVIESIDLAFEKYDTGTNNKDVIEFIFQKVGSILYVESLPEDQKQEKLMVGRWCKIIRGAWPNQYDYQQTARAINSYLKRGFDENDLEETYDKSEYYPDFISALYE